MPWYTSLDPDAVALFDRLFKRDPDRLPEKWLRVMCDNLSMVLWTADGCEISPEVFGFAPAVIERMDGWQKRYDTYFPEDPDVPKWTDQDWHAFSQERLEIAILVKKHLPDWTIVYHDELRIMVERSNDRSYYQYEISAEVVKTGQRPR